MATPDEWLASLERLMSPLKTSADMFDQIAGAVTSVNNALGESRVRTTEFSAAIADSIRDVTRLGGGAQEIAATIAGIADGSRRNVIATSESINELFAATQYVDRSATQITEAFGKVGMDISLVGERMVDNISYVQSIGLNAKQIMGEVVDNMDLMNRYNFEDGVYGLTKMVAQASMLRFDMNETAKITEKAMDPEGAIELASAFQRLGVTVGTLVDPFAMMDASINNPGALQDSVIDLAKTYAQFDEKTQRFEINPYGLRMLREVENQTGLSAENLKKTALAALELDKRLSDISFNIDASDEDKMLVANLAKRDEGGEYIVKVSDEEGYKKLSELSDNQFKQIVQTQKDTPKTMEEIALKQLSLSDLQTNYQKAMADGLAAALVGQTSVFRNYEGIRGIGETVQNASFAALPSPEEQRKMFEGVGNDIRESVYKAVQSRKTEDIGAALKSIEELYKGVPGKTADALKTFVQNLQVDKPKSELENTYNSLIGKLQSMGGVESKNVNVKQDVSINGSVKFQVDTPSGLSRQELESIFNSKEFQNQMYKAIVERANVSTLKIDKE